MKSQFDTPGHLSGFFSRVLCDENRITRLDAQLDAEVDGLAFHVLADGDSAVISFDSLSDAFLLCKRFAGVIRKLNDTNVKYRSLLRNQNVTVYLQNRHFGIIGPKAGPIISRVFSLATSFLGKA